MGLIFIALLLTAGFAVGGWFLGKPRGWHILGLCVGLFAGLIMFVAHFVGGVFIGAIGLILAGTLPPMASFQSGARIGGGGGPRPEGQAEVIARLEKLRNDGVLSEEEYKKAVKRAVGVD